MSVFHGPDHFWQLEKWTSNQVISHSHPPGFGYFMLFIVCVCVCLMRSNSGKHKWTIKVEKNQQKQPIRYLKPNHTGTYRVPNEPMNKLEGSVVGRNLQYRIGRALMGKGHHIHAHKDNTLHSLVNHNVGTNGDGGKKKGWGGVRNGWGDSLHDFFVNHRADGTSPRSHKTPVPPDFTGTRSPSCPLRLGGNQCGLEKKWAGNIGKAQDYRSVHRSSDGCSLLAVSRNFVGG